MQVFCPCCKFQKEINPDRVGKLVDCDHCGSPFIAEDTEFSLVLPEEEAGEILLGDNWKPRPSSWRKVSTNNTMLGIITTSKNLPPVGRKEENHAQRRSNNILGMVLGPIILLIIIFSITFYVNLTSPPTRFVDKFELIKSGMTPLEVEKLLGPPFLNLASDGNTLASPTSATRVMVYNYGHESFFIYISEFRVVYTERK